MGVEKQGKLKLLAGFGVLDAGRKFGTRQSGNGCLGTGEGAYTLQPRKHDRSLLLILVPRLPFATGKSTALVPVAICSDFGRSSSASEHCYSESVSNVERRNDITVTSGQFQTLSRPQATQHSPQADRTEALMSPQMTQIDSCTSCTWPDEGPRIVSCCLLGGGWYHCK